MTRWFNIASQIVLGLGQIVNLAEPVMGKEAKVYVAIGLGVATLIISSIAHAYNPDGTSARAAYTPDKETRS